jgi:PAS domain S-box-containing protein
MYYSEACMNFPAILLLIDPNNGKIIAANKKAKKTYGYSIEKLCTMNISEINVLKPEQIKQEINNAASEARNYFHFPHKTAYGKIINMEVESYPTQIHDKAYLFSIIYPSNERNVFINAGIDIMDKSTDAILVLDPSNRVIKVNASFENLFKCKETNIIGEFANTLIKGVEQHKYEYLMSELVNGNSEEITLKIEDDGQIYDYVISGIPTFYLNNYFGSIISIRKNYNLNTAAIEKNKELEKRLQEMEKTNSDKDDFLARMSHDMRTPMNAILGMANFGLEEIEDPKALKYFSQIKDSSDYLLALINDILDMQKLENGEIKFDEVITNTPRIAQKVKNIVEPRAAQKNIELNYELQCEDKFNYVKVDERRIEQILINILNNAIKYTPEGGRVTWRDFVSDLPNGKIKVTHEFIDNGVGMSRHFQKTMFDPFTTEVNSQTQSESGSGLGLAITKNLVNAMGGNITCKSKLGEGTTFIVELLLTLATDKEITEFITKSTNLIGATIIRGKKILICEDVDVNIMIVKKLLSVYDCEFDVAKNGLEGVNYARAKNYAAILMDIRMPIMNGLEAAKKIREFDSEVPIIALSANAYTEDIDKSLKAGMNAHLAKPINKQDLYSTLTNLLC